MALRILLALVSLFLLGRGGFEIHRSGLFGAPLQLDCPGPRGEPLEPRRHLVAIRGGAPQFDEMMYLRRDEQVVGVMLPLRRKRDEPFIGVLMQVTQDDLVARIVDDETKLAPEELPEFAVDEFVGALIPRDKVSAGRTERLILRYDDLDPAFRILELGESPDWTDGGVMLLFGLLGLWGTRRLETL